MKLSSTPHDSSRTFTDCKRGTNANWKGEETFRSLIFWMILYIFVTSREKRKPVWASVLNVVLVCFFTVATHFRLSLFFWDSLFSLSWCELHRVSDHTHIKNTQQKDVGQFASSLSDPHSASQWPSSCARFTKRTSWMIYCARHSFWVPLSVSWCEGSVVARCAE